MHVDSFQIQSISDIYYQLNMVLTFIYIRKMNLTIISVTAVQHKHTFSRFSPSDQNGLNMNTEICSPFPVLHLTQQHFIFVYTIYSNFCVKWAPPF